MSFLPDLAGWALSGGAGGSNNDDPNDNDNSADVPMEQESEEEIRAKRLARLSARFDSNVPKKESANHGSSVKAIKTSDTSPMEVETGSTDNGQKTATPVPIAITDVGNKAESLQEEGPKKKRAKELPEKQDPARKLQRKKELLIKKILKVKLTGGSIADPECIEVDIGSALLTVENIAEILASRLAISPKSGQYATSGDKAFFAYLGSCHKRASEELKNMPVKSNDLATTEELKKILNEMKTQLVSFAASSLIYPDLFELAKDGPSQITHCLANSTLDPASSITIGVAGKNSSFFGALCDELINQDLGAFETVVADILKEIKEELLQCETVLDSSGSNGLVHISALNALCSYKKAAIVVAKTPGFLLPEEGTPKAAEKISIQPPSPPPGASQQQQQIFRMMAAMSGRNSSYLRRSGPALEKETLLGLIFRLGVPMDNKSVTEQFQGIAKRSRNNIKNTTDGLRRQLRVYQDSVHIFLKSLITAGENARTPVLQWITDALLVNVGATALRPDKTKVSNPQTLQNIAVVLLKLCERFMDDPSRIHPGFVWSEEDNGGIFATSGDDVVSRLGENAESCTEPYDARNKFIPQCFFLCARALHLSVVAGASQHTNILRQVNHTAWNLRQRNLDVANDNNFNYILSIQFANEVSMLAPELVIDSLRFFNLTAAFLTQTNDKALPHMPEHLVSDICEYLAFVSKHAEKQMEGVDLGNIFKVVVKLLSPQYASLVRNYNLRAKLGDVLHDVYLPPDSNGRSSLSSQICCDPRSGGQPYLISDADAQESLAPSLLLLYGEVEHTGYYEKMGHRANIASLLQFLWASKEHRNAFRRITQNKTSFITFANGIMNEMNSLIVTVMEKLPEIRRVQLQMANPTEWGAVPEEERETISSRHEENEQEVKRALPLCNKTLKMLGFLSTDSDIRSLFLLDELCPRLVNMLLHVLTKLVGAKGMELKV